jgi:hypothetical protein
MKYREYSGVAINNYLSRKQQKAYDQLKPKLKNYVGSVLLATGDPLDLASARLILDVIELNSDAGNSEGFFLEGLVGLSSKELKNTLETLFGIVKSNLGEAFFRCAYTQENMLYDTPTLLEILSKFQIIVPYVPASFSTMTTFPPYRQGGKEILDEFTKNPENLALLENVHSEIDAKIISEIGDAVRGTLLASKLMQVPLLIEKVNALIINLGGQVIGLKDFWNKPSKLGYVGIHLKVFLPLSNGSEQAQPAPNSKFLLGEVQIHLPNVMDGTLACPKELAHRLYKAQGNAAAEEAPPELVSASNLIYLIGVTKLLKSENEPGVASGTLDAAVKNILNDLAPERAEFIYPALEAVQFLKDNQYGEAVWDSQRQAIVPSNHEAVTKAFKDRVVAAKKWENLTVGGNPQNVSACHNTAKSVRELMADAKVLAPHFEEMCKNAAASQQGCKVTFGPDNTCMKQKESLLKKIKDDRIALLKAAAA